MLLTLLPSLLISTAGCCFYFDSVSSFFLELFLHWSPVAYWAPNNPGSSSFIVLSLWLFVLFMEFSRQECWSLPFPSPVDHIFFRTLHHDPSILGGPTSMAYSSTELDKAVVHVIRLVSFLWLWFQSVCPLMKKDKRLMEATWWERLTEGKTGSCSDGWGHVQ